MYGYRYCTITYIISRYKAKSVLHHARKYLLLLYASVSILNSGTSYPHEMGGGRTLTNGVHLIAHRQQLSIDTCREADRTVLCTYGICQALHPLCCAALCRCLDRPRRARGVQACKVLADCAQIRWDIPGPAACTYLCCPGKARRGKTKAKARSSKVR